MALRTEVRPVGTPEDLSELGALMAEPEAVYADPPRFAPQAAGVLLALLLASPSTPKEPEE
ncbi:hypothetical protein [Saccharothrix sp. Mg75]|uniref:hypothetical protein n=1 Tax=Saccharothrix sp. Mg75 TaxID=3445357 RepID=UPI003EEDFD9E